MQSQFGVFNNEKLKEKPLMAGLNYFLTDKARGGESDKLLGEKQDVKVWLAWLERFKHGEAEAVDTPIGEIPTYEKLKDLFNELIDKNYTKSLYDKQFSLYLGNIISRLKYQMEEYGKIKSSQKIPDLYFTELQAQIDKLNRLQAEYGDVITPDQLLEIAQ
jgi:phosphoenolpyruvate carboxykinase (GTP)